MSDQEINTASKTLKQWGTDAQEKAKAVQQKIGHAKDATLQYVDENPRKATMMAAAVGAAVGALVALIIGGRRK